MIDIVKKWQQRWSDSKIYEPKPDIRPKFFVTYPYPYMNSRPHIGHAYTMLRGDIIARYKRMKGFNVLFPFAFHCSGTPIIAAARRIREKEKKQIDTMLQSGIEREEIDKFSDPIYWTEYFPKLWESDVRELGLSIDWSRKFMTTYLNPYYDKFVQWQFRKLKEKNYIRLGEHPVIWCPKCNNPVGDHDRIGLDDQRVTLIEYTLLKCKLDANTYLVAATLRPETVYGQTNLWVNPDVAYMKIRVNDEIWVVSRECYNKLQHQKQYVIPIEDIESKNLIGKYCDVPGINKKVIVLPSTLCDPNIGTGIVTSVPSDAPDDWIVLHELQENRAVCEKYGVEYEVVKKIKPIPIIKSELGEFPAIDICDRLSIKSHTEKEKLNKAKDIVYKTGFYTGIMETSPYKDMKVIEAKERIKKDMIANKEADIFYEISTDVKCRCLTSCIVKIVSNQWFIAYGDTAWKERVHKALEKINLYPQIVRNQFNKVVDWVDDWACTREFGLGSHLPWEERWVIDSLSDSTIYMAYYTISKYLNEKTIDPEKVSDALYDYVFLGEGDVDRLSNSMNVLKDTLLKMREEFEYWYPFDLRVSGKDLVQNHLTFCIFNHVAIFPEKYYPNGFGINGWVMIGKEKISKSTGTTLMLRKILDMYGVDVTRLTLGWAGEGIDDPIWDTDFAESCEKRIENWYRYAIENYDKGREDFTEIDKWFLSMINRTIKMVTECMEDMKFRSALKIGYFDFQTHLRWYLRRCSAIPNKTVINKFIETQTKILAPYIPHICEEIWEKLGFKEFISLSEYPACNENEIYVAIELSEEYLKSLLEDIRNILVVTKIKPSKIVLYTTPQWKQKIFARALKMAKSNMLHLFMRTVMVDPEFKDIEGVDKYAKKCITILEQMENDIEKFEVTVEELSYLEHSKEFISREFNCSVEIYSADNPVYDPQKKSQYAEPRRPGIYIE